MESLETERHPAKPPLRPKPPMPKRAQDDGWPMGGEGRPARPPVPTKRPVSEFPAGEVPQGWGNVRKIRERFNQAAELPERERVGAAKEKRPLAVRRSESAREVLRDSPPVPKARRKRVVAREKSAKRNEDQTPTVPAITEIPASQEPSSDHRVESRAQQTDAPGETAAGRGHCPISCPCLCHKGRPGMVLVWRPASDANEGDPGLTDCSLSDSAESDDKPFAYVFTVNETPNGCPGEIAAEEDDSYLRLLPSAPEETLEAADPDGSLERSVSPPTPLPKPPRRHKPVAQTSLDKAPRLPARRQARLHRSAALPLSPPPSAATAVPQRYSAADLDKFSKCVDQLNLHVRHLALPGRTASTLEPPSPTVTRSAPPSPKEKHITPTYDQVDAGEEENSRNPLYEFPLDVPPRRSSQSESRNSKGWESRFESEPLYQTYRDTVIHKQIKRQTLMRDSSKTSDDYTYESIPLTLDSDRASSSLWQNLNAVRQSGILDGLSPEERKQQESMFEVLTSEASYLRSLNILIDHFMDSRVLNESIILRDKKTLFSSIVRVAEVSARYLIKRSFLKDLEERVDENIRIRDVCDIIYDHAQLNFQVYIDYVRNQFYQEQKYSQLMEENAHFAAAVVRLQELPQCQRLPLMSFLLLPFQRITRIKMLIENILQRSEVGSANEETASKALSVVSKIIEDCNREVGIMKQMEEMIHIMKKLEFDKLKAIPIISKLRHLEKRGELSEVVQKGNRFGVKPKVTFLYLFLFNDLLLVTVKKSGDRYQVLDYAHRSLVEVQECPSNWPGTSAANCFMLTLLENRLGKQSERLLKAPTQSDRHRWMSALSSGRYVSQEDTKDDKVYECWDCPQVQCLIPYTAQQADELSLEAADIINVTKKSSEGWYEGSKLANGQKGWFPSDRVQEITNEHVRRRNLRERYRLLQAAQHLHDKQDGSGTGGERANASL